jgi:GH15 family glucan-1,4-alpha-glucosidase
VSDTHGSLVAAPTFGLPEAIGGGRNWDYRYCWIRDASFTIYALLRLGLTLEAQRYRSWIRDRLIQCAACEDLKLMYRLDGSLCLEEKELPHLSGYRGSRPVRVGNAAADQVQIDIYGELVDGLYLAHKSLTESSETDLEQLRQVIDEVCEKWNRPGSGFWEMRGEPQHFLDARVMSWVAVDRGIRLAQKTGTDAPERWRDEREAIARSVHEEFWNERVGAFAQTRGGDTVDSVALLMPLLRFIPADDPRFLSTLEVIEERLADGCLLRRYETPPENVEGLDGDREGFFVACSFWRIECLARCGRADEARRHMDTMLRLGSPLGLFSEEIARDGTFLGNMPQALSHLALVSAALAVNRALDEGGGAF